MKQFEGGRCLVANRVIDQMIAIRAAEVDGVLEVRGFDASTGALRHGYDKSIITETENGALSTELSIMVDKNSIIIDVVKEVQEAVRLEVEAILGLHCKRVDVHVI